MELLNSHSHVVAARRLSGLYPRPLDFFGIRDFDSDDSTQGALCVAILPAMLGGRSWSFPHLLVIEIAWILVSVDARTVV
jgi:hypothetical protein